MNRNQFIIVMILNVSLTHYVKAEYLEEHRKQHIIKCLQKLEDANKNFRFHRDTFDACSGQARLRAIGYTMCGGLLGALYADHKMLRLRGFSFIGCFAGLCLATFRTSYLRIKTDYKPLPITTPLWLIKHERNVYSDNYFQSKDELDVTQREARRAGFFRD